MIIGGWRIIDADPGLGGQVRAQIRSVIGGHGCPVDQDEAALVVAELFANAVMHGPAGGRVLVGHCLWGEGARIVVCDGGGPATPRLSGAGGLVEHGRGLRIVDSLAARWGTFRLPGAQVVWSDLGQPLRAPAREAWAWVEPLVSACPLSPPVQACGPGAVIGAGRAGAR